MLKRYILLLIKYRKLFIGFVFTMTLISIIVSLLLPKWYLAEASFIAPELAPNTLLSMGGGLSSVIQSFTGQRNISGYSYLAILNSKVFEEIMSLFTVRLQGGQMRLEARFLSQVPLPDVTNEMSCPSKVVQDLVDLGKAIHAGGVKAVAPDLDKHVSLLYGL